METLHATCVAIEGKGVLLCGPSGSGKSDLALRLIDGGARLVADDVVALHPADGQMIASLPERGRHLSGVLEVRGLGLMRVPVQESVALHLAVDLALATDRLPEARTRHFEGVAVPSLSLNALEPSAPAKIRAALAWEMVA